MIFAWKAGEDEGSCVSEVSRGTKVLVEEKRKLSTFMMCAYDDFRAATVVLCDFQI